MQNNEVLTRLQNLIGYMPQQKELILKTGINQSTLSSKSSRNSNWKESEITLLNNAYNVDIYKNISHNNANENYIEMNVTEKVSAFIYPEVFGSCGNGVFELSQERYPIQIPKDYFFKDISKNKTYSVINAYGESMQPTISDGDKLIVEHLETGEQIQDNRIYVFCYDNRISVKRLIYNIDEVIIKSDNPDKDIYKTKYIQKTDIKNLYVIGQIVGLIRDCR